ncbi:di-heme oxidoreductase family protein (plasmid) [Pseudoalteromonas sp. T1lg65]|uniref:di-heme oxidoreductase family protein n=1 Tax=Pseudoalteromonas sp. T1lg65 TaxID=2077101 RepID=UPI003F78F497
MLSSVLALTTVAALSGQAVPDISSKERFPAGDATASKLNKRTFIEPVGNVNTMALLDFWNGFSFFRDPWVAAPAITTDRDGLGPLYNARSCKACHLDGGRGKLPKQGQAATPALLFRFLPLENNLNTSPFGGQLQPFAVRLSHSELIKQSQGEGNFIVSYQFIDGQFDDGTRYQLRKPSYQYQGEFGKALANARVGVSARYAPAIYGMGLLDAIDQDSLLSMQDPEDENGDGVSARYNLVKNVQNGALEVGRFGFKGLHPTLEQQIAAAFVNDIGITNHLFTKENCLDHQLGCQQAAKFSAGLDIPKKLHDLTLYMSQLVTVPPVRDLDSATAQQGRRLFYQLNCHSCHTPTLTTSPRYPIKALAGQEIWPYSDLALHDMGEGLADEGYENLASGREWRTAPLWGIGMQLRVQGYQAYLHDGRARSIEEAILWHGGEAASHQQAYKSLNKAQRDVLLYFLNQI